ncbi:hypothetical protein BJ878DRAFT_414963 [Calycina marina]|uniref:Protein YAE1 n=1 Tax=Calycina marina TaxID=1763456 RepID=A0A9P7Z9F3_9HELO|nr:hypothetical protein BJ878DRAFT_414963 [Calycina marina]
MAPYKTSAPATPFPHSTSQAAPQENDSLNDVFGSDNEDFQGAGGNAEYSDIPRLREKHETEGYRDGIGQGKAQTVQKGFDEGYHLGAVLGLRIGKVLGLLEGIWKAVSNVPDAGEDMKSEEERLGALWREAKDELNTEKVFGRQWWGEDGIWMFEVHGENEGEVTFEDVANQHPIVKTWEGIVAKEVEKLGIDLDILAGEEDGAREPEVPMKKIVTRKSQAEQKDTLRGAAQDLSW